MCGLVTDNSGNRKVVVTGGYKGSNGNVAAAVESFNLQTMRWSRETDDFPFTPVAWPTNIQWGRTFLTVGGYNPQTGFSDLIYRVC